MSGCRIQIHLMLLFIGVEKLEEYRKFYSNTSHVIVYLVHKDNAAWLCLNSNTSHVIVYPYTVGSYTDIA